LRAEQRRQPLKVAANAIHLLRGFRRPRGDH
jgi:hypothetical protein